MTVWQEGVLATAPLSGRVYSVSTGHSNINFDYARLIFYG